MAQKEPRRFYLLRRDDQSGVSGTGRVADGIEFVDGSAAIRWRSDFRSTAVYDDMETLVAIHGHNGATTVHFID